MCEEKMNIPDLPIIFDAGSELDTQSLNTRLNTNAQLIMTKVDDIHYTDVTLIRAQEDDFMGNEVAKKQPFTTALAQIQDKFTNAVVNAGKYEYSVQ